MRGVGSASALTAQDEENPEALQGAAEAEELESRAPSDGVLGSAAESGEDSTRTLTAEQQAIWEAPEGAMDAELQERWPGDAMLAGSAEGGDERV